MDSNLLSLPQLLAVHTVWLGWCNTLEYWPNFAAHVLQIEENWSGEYSSIEHTVSDKSIDTGRPLAETREGVFVCSNQDSYAVETYPNPLQALPFAPLKQFLANFLRVPKRPFCCKTGLCCSSSFGHWPSQHCFSQTVDLPCGLQQLSRAMILAHFSVHEMCQYDIKCIITLHVISHELAMIWSHRSTPLDHKQCGACTWAWLYGARSRSPN